MSNVDIGLSSHQIICLHTKLFINSKEKIELYKNQSDCSPKKGSKRGHSAFDLCYLVCKNIKHVMTITNRIPWRLVPCHEPGSKEWGDLFHWHWSWSEEFLKVMRDAGELWNLRISAYCLMPNRYHLLVQTPEGNLSRCMRHINGVYTQRFNCKIKRKDSCFEDAIKLFL